MGRPWWRRPGLWPTGTYTDWRWPPAPRGYRRFEWRLTPETDPTPDGYFWSHQFGLLGGQAGYAGLQTLGSEPAGKIAIFSVWQAEGAEGPEMAGPFGGEGTGFTARIAYRWQPGATYRLVVASPAPATWEARVADEARGEERLVGRIRVPAAWGGLRDASVMWTERYSGPLAGCADIRHASAVFSTPSADDGVAPLGRHNHLWQPPGCPGSAVQDVPGGVRQVMGAP